MLLRSSIFLVWMILLIQGMIRWFTLRIRSDAWAASYMSWSPASIDIRTSPSGIRYVVIGDESTPPILLIHGAFGGFRHWQAFATNPAIYENYHLVIPERPWYSKEYRQPVLDIIQEAELLIETLEQKENIITFGVSYGAAASVYICHIYKHGCTHAAAGAWAFFAEHNPVYGWSYVSDYFLWRLFLPHVFYVWLQENLSKDTSLSAIEETYKEFTQPLLLFHAIDDPVIPYDNSKAMLELLPNKTTLVRTDGIRHQVQEAIPYEMFARLDAFVKSSEDIPWDK